MEAGLKLRIIFLLAAMSFVQRSVSAQSEAVLVPVQPANGGDREMMDQVTARARQMKLKGIELFEKQSFKLVRDGRWSAYL